MKKVLALILLLAMTAALFAGCGSSKAPAFFSAIRQAVIFAQSGMIEEIKANIDYMKIKAEKPE